MVKDSLGLIETVGLAAAVEAADAAVKSANVRLIGYELTKGGGMVVVKVGGDVGAVKAAVDAGVAAARKVNKVYASHVIPRPHQQISGVVWTRETVGWKSPAVPAEPPAPAAASSEPPVPAAVAEEPADCPQPADEQVTAMADAPLPAEENVPAATETPPSAQDAEAVTESAAGPVEPEQQEMTPETSPRKRPEDICNLCGDPACPRVKGDPRVTCIHFEKNNNKEAE